MQKTYHKLYARDSSGKVRVWWCEQDFDKIRNISGTEDGAKVESKWKLITAKNVGKRNEIPADRQAEKEIEAMYKKQIKKHGYFVSKADIDNEASFIKPMLAEKYQDNPITDPTERWFSQAKLDGWRCIANAERATGKSGDKFATVDHIVERLAELAERPEIKAFDGELYNHELREDFNTIASLLSKKKPTHDDLNRVYDLIQFHIYDFVPTEEYAHLTYIDRRAILEYVIPKDDDRLILVDHAEVEGETIEEVVADIEKKRQELIELEFEGQMLRRGTSLYQIDTRTKDLQKNKVFIDREFKISRILEGKGNGAGLGKKVELFNDDGSTFRAGVNGNGAFTKKLLEEKDLYDGGKGEATIRYFSLTPKGVPRFGKAVAFFVGNRKF